MRNSFVLALAAMLFVSSCGRGGDSAPESVSETAAVADAGAGETAPLGRLGEDVIPGAYRLDLVIDPNETHFEGRIEIDVAVSRDLDRIWLHGKGLSVTDAYATFGDSRVNAAYEEVDVTGVARLDFDETLPAGGITLHIAWSAPFMTVPDGLYRTEENSDHYVASQLQSISARKVFPGFDEPRFKTPYSITITAKTTDTVVTATREVSSQDLGDGTTRHVFQTTEPLPTYLLAFAIGPYDVNEWQAIPANGVRQVPLPLRGIAVRGRGARMDYALEHTADFVHHLEDYFAVPHPYPKLDILAPPDFFGGAMENAGAIMYTEYLVLMDESSALSQRRSYARVHAHEIAHQWFGNYVTPAWWDDIWLNESFASWIQYKIAAQTWPEGQFERGVLVRGLNAMRDDSLASARQIREPVETNATIDDAFDSITYQKGGAVLTMFETYLGEDAFRKGVRTHMQRFAHGTATVDDFMQSLADGSGRPEVRPAFQSFIDQPGVPLLEVRIDCDDSPSLEIRQSRYAPLGSGIDPQRTWQIPMCASVSLESGPRQVCALVDTPEMSLPLDTETCPDYVVPNGDGSGYFRFALDAAGWAALADAADTLDASQALAYADSLDAAFRAGAASADDLLEGMTALARHEAWDTVSEAMARYEGIIDATLNDDARHDLQLLGSQLYRPLADAISDGDDPQTVLLRANLTRFLAIVALDPGTRSELVEDARRYVGIAGTPDTSAVEPDIAETVLSVGVQEDGEPYFDALLELVNASDDPALRAYGLGALARTEDALLTVRLLDTIAGDGFSAPELIRALYRQLARPDSRDAAWQWAQQNFDSIVDSSSGIFGIRAAAGLGGSFCSAERASEYESLIRSNVDRLPGFERTLAQALEQIDLCIALDEARSDELAEAAAGRL